jgi:hypothetical protein
VLLHNLHLYVFKQFGDGKSFSLSSAEFEHEECWVRTRCQLGAKKMYGRRWHYWHLVAIAGTASRLAVTLGWIQEIRSISIVLIEIVYCEYSLRGA